MNYVRLKSFIALIILIAASLSLSACQPQQPSKPKTKEMALNKPVNVDLSNKEKKMDFQYRGTVKYFKMEGGFFGIETDKGQKFLPMKIADKSVLQDGAIIEFSGDQISGMMTIQQWGTPFEVTKVNLIKPGKKVDLNKGRDAF